MDFCFFALAGLLSAKPAHRVPREEPVFALAGF